MRWPRIMWIHLPAAVWAVFVELFSGVCPLTPLEQVLRREAGLPAYSGDFVANYIFPLLYPEGLTRGAQFAIAGLVVATNVLAYAWVFWRRSRRPI